MVFFFFLFFFFQFFLHFELEFLEYVCGFIMKEDTVSVLIIEY